MNCQYCKAALTPKTAPNGDKYWVDMTDGDGCWGDDAGNNDNQSHQPCPMITSEVPELVTAKLQAIDSKLLALSKVSKILGRNDHILAAHKEMNEVRELRQFLATLMADLEDNNG